MAELLTRKDKKQISRWIGRDCQFELLYKISRDGTSYQTFHNLCDNKGPTVTIFYNKDNNVYGGTCQTAGGVLGAGVQTRQRFFLNYILLVTGNQRNSNIKVEELILKQTITDHGFLRWLHGRIPY